MSFLIFSIYINLFTSFVLGIFVLWRNPHNPVNRTFFVFCLTLFLWSLFYALCQHSTDSQQALYWLRLLMASAFFIPICYLHHVYSLLEKYREYRLRIVLSYIFGILAAVLCYTPLLIKGISSKFGYRYWPDAGEYFFPFLLLWFMFVVLGVYAILKVLIHSSGTKKEQFCYLLVATLIGWIGGGTNYPLWFNIPIHPVGNICMSIYVVIVTYAIVRYRLMDIRVAVSSAGIFIAVYALTIGVPILLYSQKMYFWALFSMGLLATPAPFIYAHFQRRAEEGLLKEERRYQDALMQAADTFADKISLEDISRSIVSIIDRTIHPKHSAFYLFDGEKCVLKETAGSTGIYPDEILKGHPLLGALSSSGVVHVEELKRQAASTDDDGDDEVVVFFEQHPASVVVPFKRLDTMVGILFLGEKVNAASYSDRDLMVLKDMAINGTLALVNAIHIARTTKTIEEEMHDYRLRDMGVIGASISHQVSNRLQIVINFLGLFARRFAPEKVSALPKEEILERFNSMIPLMPEIMDNAIKAAEISDALKTQGKLSKDAHAVALKRLVKMGRAIAEAKHQGLKYEFIEEYDDTLTLWANESSMQDILFNLFDNSLDSIATKLKGNEKPEGYVGRIKVAAYPEGDMAIITVEDNGIGMRQEDLEKAFVTHYTTKGTDKGTGLGLYIIHQFIRHSKGAIKVDAKSNEWARFTISFPMIGTKTS